MALRRKLYYDVTIGPAATGLTREFEITPGTFQRPDRYGNLMDRNFPNGATGNIARCRQAIGAWFICSTMTMGGADFIIDYGTGSPFVRIGGVNDPATVRRPRVRLRGFLAGAGDSVTGVLYVQRQHSEEV